MSEVSLYVHTIDLAEATMYFYNYMPGILLYAWYIVIYLVYCYIPGILLYAWYIVICLVYCYMPGILLYA